MGILYTMFSFIDRYALCFIYFSLFPNISLSKVFIRAPYFPICKACFTQLDALEMSLMVHDNADHKMPCNAF